MALNVRRHTASLFTLAIATTALLPTSAAHANAFDRAWTGIVGAANEVASSVGLSNKVGVPYRVADDKIMVITNDGLVNVTNSFSNTTLDNSPTAPDRMSVDAAREYQNNVNVAQTAEPQAVAQTAPATQDTAGAKAPAARSTQTKRTRTNTAAQAASPQAPTAEAGKESAPKADKKKTAKERKTGVQKDPNKYDLTALDQKLTLPEWEAQKAARDAAGDPNTRLPDSLNNDGAAAANPQPAVTGDQAPDVGAPATATGSSDATAAATPATPPTDDGMFTVPNNNKTPDATVITPNAVSDDASKNAAPLVAQNDGEGMSYAAPANANVAAPVVQNTDDNYVNPAVKTSREAEREAVAKEDTKYKTPAVKTYRDAEREADDKAAAANKKLSDYAGYVVEGLALIAVAFASVAGALTLRKPEIKLSNDLVPLHASEKEARDQVLAQNPDLMVKGQVVKINDRSYEQETFTPKDEKQPEDTKVIIRAYTLEFGKGAKGRDFAIGAAYLAQVERANQVDVHVEFGDDTAKNRAKFDAALKKAHLDIDVRQAAAEQAAKDAEELAKKQAEALALMGEIKKPAPADDAAVDAAAPATPATDAAAPAAEAAALPPSRLKRAGRGMLRALGLGSTEAVQATRNPEAEPTFKKVSAPPTPVIPPRPALVEEPTVVPITGSNIDPSVVNPDFTDIQLYNIDMATARAGLKSKQIKEESGAKTSTYMDDAKKPVLSVSKAGTALHVHDDKYIKAFLVSTLAAVGGNIKIEGASDEFMQKIMQEAQHIQKNLHQSGPSGNPFTGPNDKPVTEIIINGVSLLNPAPAPSPAPDTIVASAGTAVEPAKAANDDVVGPTVPLATTAAKFGAMTPAG